MKTVYIGLGSNIEPRKQYLQKAVQQLAEQQDITLVKQSSIYETAPVDYTEQADFLNMVVQIETTLAPHALLLVCQQIEKMLGRDRMKETIAKGPRTIDLDILLYEDKWINEDHLEIPHPRMHERAFVLVPLNEIAPHVVLPNVGKSITQLIAKLPHQDLQSVRKWLA